MKDMRAKALVVVMISLFVCLTGCKAEGSHKTAKTKPARSSCHKAPSPEDETFWVIEWKFHVAQVGTNMVNYYTFKYSPSSAKEPCKDAQSAKVCDHDVTTDTALTNTCKYLTRTKSITEIVVRKGGIKSSDANTGDCTCP